MIMMAVHQMVLGISLAAPVGPINIEMIKRGISHGFWASWLVGLGGMSADILFMAAIFLGMAPFLQQPFVRMILYGMGFLMLLYLGIQSIKQSFQSTRLMEHGSAGQAGTSFLTGLMIAGANPLNILFWFGIYGSALGSIIKTESMVMSLIYSLFIIAGIMLWNLNIAFTVHFTKHLLTDRMMKIITFTAGLILVYFSLKFGWALYESIN
ncbi:LysE family transporter [Priestia abyssalis]|uniref:LysE family transporter n=1 Tax=Priestia abyssalis TaxID=1221450 RepID=UPI000995C020|nr:LysE family transporter [Priestia abyssalis]